MYCSATAAQVAMVSWLPTGSWLGTQEACPQWPCLNLPMAAWQEAVRSRRLALASPSDAQAVGSPCLAGFPCARIRLQGTDVVATFPAAVGLASPSRLPGPDPLYCIFPRFWGSEAVQFWGLGSLDCPSAWNSCVQVWGQDQRQSRRPQSVCVCLSCLVPGLSLICQSVSG